MKNRSWMLFRRLNYFTGKARPSQFACHFLVLIVWSTNEIIFSQSSAKKPRIHKRCLCGVVLSYPLLFLVIVSYPLNLYTIINHCIHCFFFWHKLHWLSWYTINVLKWSLHSWQKNLHIAKSYSCSSICRYFKGI